MKTLRIVVIAAVVAAMTLVTGGVAIANGQNRCLSIDGVEIVAEGTATCVSTVSTGAEPNVARATGDGAFARASFREGSTATATGDGAEARAFDGSTATATGVGAEAGASRGSTATATGVGAEAGASTGSTATATGNGAYALAQSRGGASTATAVGNGAYAETYDTTVDGTAIAVGNGALARVREDTRRGTAIARGDGAFADIDECDSDCEAHAIGVNARAGAFDGPRAISIAEGRDASATVWRGVDSTATARGYNAEALSIGDHNTALARGANAYACAGSFSGPLDTGESAVNEDLCS